MKPDFLPDLDTAKRLILELGHQGVRLGTNGRHVTYDAPRGVLTVEVKELLRVNRSIICNLLGPVYRVASVGGTTTSLLPRVNPTRARLHCAYRSHADWISIYGVIVCRTCHPPAAPHLVAEERA